MDFKKIPIFIISWNRTETLKCCLERYVRDGYTNIIVVDNASTNESHIKYLKSLQCKVVFLKKNCGARGIWECGLFDKIIENNYYVVTDPDILPVEQCPANYLEEFYEILQAYPNKRKVGFALKIDDLPESYPNKYVVMCYESTYYDKKLSWKFPIYDAAIDTTFALYRPGKKGRDFFSAIRTGYPYMAYHLGWYPDKFNQQKYFQDKQNVSASSMSEKAMNVYRRLTIAYLACAQDENFYILLKRMYTRDFIRKHADWKVTLQGLFYIIYKKVETDVHVFKPIWTKGVEKLKMLFH